MKTEIFKARGRRHSTHAITGTLEQYFDLLDKIENETFWHNSSMENGAYWYGTETFADAKEGFTFGFPEIVEQIKTGMALPGGMKCGEPRKVKRNTLDVQGLPIMPLVMQGLPANCSNRTKTLAKDSGSITIAYNMTATAGVDSFTLTQSAINLGRTINALESKGYKVRLIAIPFASTVRNADVLFTYLVKDYDQKISPLNLSTMCHVSTFRRIGFKLYESYAEEHPETQQRGYGRPADFPTIETTIKRQYDCEKVKIMGYRDCRNEDSIAYALLSDY